MNDNLPVGAAYDSDAPYNQKDSETTSCSASATAYITLSTNITGDVEAEVIDVEFDEDNNPSPILGDIVDYSALFDCAEYEYKDLIKSLKKSVTNLIRKYHTDNDVRNLASFISRLREYEVIDVDIEDIEKQ